MAPPIEEERGGSIDSTAEAAQLRKTSDFCPGKSAAQATCACLANSNERWTSASFATLMRAMVGNVQGLLTSAE